MGTVCTWRHSLVRVRIHRMLYKIVVINIIVTPSGGSSQITEIIVPLSFYHNLLLVFLFPVLFLLFIKKNVISCLPIFNQFCAIYIAILMAFSCNGLEISSICNVQDPPPPFYKLYGDKRDDTESVPHVNPSTGMAYLLLSLFFVKYCVESCAEPFDIVPFYCNHQ